ncbi:hypothetical protein [Endozoicomonas sp. 4G]|uniref:hypothetical protein n=1 Tax=Endozoicomonas sp. 4G TaxID=2872754 RepID=UPI002078F683|nr:hypothetical protein [Endozoicomonas sp. 4G]
MKRLLISLFLSLSFIASVEAQITNGLTAYPLPDQTSAITGSLVTLGALALRQQTWQPLPYHLEKGTEPESYNKPFLHISSDDPFIISGTEPVPGEHTLCQPIDTSENKTWQCFSVESVTSVALNTDQPLYLETQPDQSLVLHHTQGPKLTFSEYDLPDYLTFLKNQQAEMERINEITTKEIAMGRLKIRITEEATDEDTARRVYIAKTNGITVKEQKDIEQEAKRHRDDAHAHSDRFAPSDTDLPDDTALCLASNRKACWVVLSKIVSCSNSESDKTSENTSTPSQEGQETKTPANLRPQPNVDTQHATTPCLWTTSSSTHKLSPCPPRKYRRQESPEQAAKKEELLEAAKTGKLAIRRVTSSKETIYFRSEDTPRPFTLALPGVPIRRMPAGYGEWMIGIVNPHCLFTYKRDARTTEIESGASPDELKTKLLPDLRSLKEKCEEEVERALWEDSKHTTGHLREDGLFSLPKAKHGHYVCPLPYPELVTTHYNKADIKCFCVMRDPSTDISSILQAKRQCEQAWDLDPLPLIVRCQRTGTVDVYFDNELDYEHLEKNERVLDEFALSQNLSPDNLRILLNLLPMPLQAEALGSKLIVPSGGAPSDGKHQQAIQLVSDPCHYSYQSLLELKQSGLLIHHRFIHEGNVRSLLDMLLSSEMLRHDHPKQERIQEQEKEAYRSLQLLLQSGAKLDEQCLELIDKMVIEAEPVMPPGILSNMVAAFAPFKCLTLQHLRRIPLVGCPGSVVEFDRICQRLSPQQRQSCLKKVLRYVKGFNCPTLDIIQRHLLALFHYGARVDEGILDKLKSSLKRSCRGGKKVINHLSLTDYIRWVEKLWQQRKTYPFYQNWPTHVQQAQRDINDLKQSLGLDAYHKPKATLATATPTALKFLVDAFNKPPVLPDHVGDNEKTILTVLQHYYRRPGPERVIESLYREPLPTVWKPKHSCSHVLRARNNGHWYMELLEKFQQCYLPPTEKELLSLAIIYHDAAAEEVEKSAEEACQLTTSNGT